MPKSTIAAIVYVSVTYKTTLRQFHTDMLTAPPTMRKYLFVMQNGALVPKLCRVELSRVVIVEKPNKRQLTEDV